MVIYFIPIAITRMLTTEYRVFGIKRCNGRTGICKMCYDSLKETFDNVHACIPSRQCVSTMVDHSLRFIYVYHTKHWNSNPTTWPHALSWPSACWREYSRCFGYTDMLAMFTARYSVYCNRMHRIFRVNIMRLIMNLINIVYHQEYACLLCRRRSMYASLLRFGIIWTLAMN